MRILTLAQPMASAVIHGGKDIENRTWRGRWVDDRREGWMAIHAGARWWAGPDGGKTTSRPSTGMLAGVAEIWRPRISIADLEDLPTSAILGAVYVSRIVPLAEVVGNPWALGPWCWRLTRVVALPSPIPYRKGALGLGHLRDPAVIVEIASALGEQISNWNEAAVL